jgi:cytochrome c biogenesis protein CcmG, thiol:disulfide interchange protein DsbE
MYKLMRLQEVAVAIVLGLSASIAAAVEPGSPAPGFDAPTFDNKPIRLADYRGKVVFVDFWASWCSPCREALPMYEKLSGEFPTSDFAVVAINVDENAADAKKFLAEHPVKYTIVQNPKGDIPKAFGIDGMPSSYLIDRDGTIRDRHVGFDPKDINALRGEIAKLIGTPAHAS